MYVKQLAFQFHIHIFAIEASGTNDGHLPRRRSPLIPLHHHPSGTPQHVCGWARDVTGRSAGGGGGQDVDDCTTAQGEKGDARSQIYSIGCSKQAHNNQP